MLDRTAAPSYIQSTTFDLIEPDKKDLANGIKIFFIHGGAQDVLRVEIIFKAGRWFEKKWGASYFASQLLTKGTKNKSSFEIAGLFDLYGAHVEISAGLDFVSVSLYTLNKNLQPVLMLLQEILKEAVFPEKEIEQLKSIYLQNLKVNNEKTSFLAAKLFRKSLFGEGHPYGKELEENDVHTLKQGDLVDHYQNCFQHFVVFVSGKIDHSNEALITDTFSNWDTKATAEVSRTDPDHKPAHYQLEKEKSVQSSVRVGRRSIIRSHPRYIETVFTSHILGGYFGSRLMKNLREEKGLTYGVYCSLHALQHGSYLTIGADVNKENVSLTFSEIRKELNRLRTEQIGTDELETARNHFIGSLQSEITTPFAHADKLKNIFLYNLPSTYYVDMISRVQRIVPADVITTATAEFHEDNFLEIAVG